MDVLCMLDGTTNPENETPGAASSPVINAMPHQENSSRSASEGPNLIDL